MEISPLLGFAVSQMCRQTLLTASSTMRQLAVENKSFSPLLPCLNLMGIATVHPLSYSAVWN